MSEELIPALAVVPVIRPPKERAQLALRHLEAHPRQERDEVVVLEPERHPYLLQHRVVGDRKLDRLGRSALVLAALVGHQAVEKVGHRLVAARLVALLVLLFEKSDDLISADLPLTEPEDVSQSRVADVQKIAEASKHVVVGHVRLARQPHLELLALDAAAAK